MKRVKVILPLIITVLLSGCAGEAEVKSREYLEQLRSSNDYICFVAEVRAEYEDGTAEFKLCYAEDTEGCTVTVEEPELIKGIKAHISDDGSSVEFNEVVLDTGTLDDYGLTPVTAMPLIAKAVKSGYLSSSRTEGDFTVMELTVDDHISVAIWFGTEAIKPERCELMSDGRTAVYCEIIEWQ